MSNKKYHLQPGKYQMKNNLRCSKQFRPIYGLVGCFKIKYIKHSKDETNVLTNQSPVFYFDWVHKARQRSCIKLPWIDNNIWNIHCTVEAVLWFPMKIPLIIIHCHIILPWKLVKQLQSNVTEQTNLRDHDTISRDKIRKTSGIYVWIECNLTRTSETCRDDFSNSK